MAKKADTQAKFEEIEKFEAETDKETVKKETKSKAKKKSEDVAYEPQQAPKCCCTGSKVALTLLLCILIASNAFLFYKYDQLNNLVTQNRNIYVYNMENSLLMAGMADENQQFEADLYALEKDIDTAKKKLNNIKDKKLKQEYQEMYMNSLKIKRDDLIKGHEKFVNTLSKNVGKALVKVANEHNVATIFSARSIAVTTPYVVDVTPQIVEILKKKMDK
ncbi:MAG: OmpH family outer membrane protein [Alphaproteobacteria bacterium]|nr:OmpH family outer membrane protein [Alphaproteobacteria bacterium]